MNSPNGEVVCYAYDSNNRRVRREYIASANGEITTYFYDGWNVIAEKRTGDTITSSVTQTHVWGLDLSNTVQDAGGVGGLLRSTVLTGDTAEMRFYTYDGNGNVASLLNFTGESSANYIYDVFGNEISANGPLSAQNKYRFSTKTWDEKTGLYYYGHRFYSTQIGRWPNRDPLGEVGGQNLYAFVRNSPISHYDPVGLVLAGCSRDPCADPCGDAKQKGLDRGHVGGVVCCSGKKYSCVWLSGGLTGAKNEKAKKINDKCIARHEDTHHDDIDCPSVPGTITRPGFKPGKDSNAGECAAYKAGGGLFDEFNFGMQRRSSVYCASAG